MESYLQMIGGSSPFEFAGAASRCSLVHTATGSVRGWAECLPVIWDDRFACYSLTISHNFIIIIYSVDVTQSQSQIGKKWRLASGFICIHHRATTWREFRPVLMPERVNDDEWRQIILNLKPILCPETVNVPEMGPFLPPLGKAVASRRGTLRSKKSAACGCWTLFLL